MHDETAAKVRAWLLLMDRLDYTTNISRKKNLLTNKTTRVSAVTICKNDAPLKYFGGSLVASMDDLLVYGLAFNKHTLYFKYFRVVATVCNNAGMIPLAR